MKFTVIVFGCQMNYADSARIKAVLTSAGHDFVETIDEADTVIFDTCSVRQKSEDKVTGKLKEIPKSKKVRITGCMIQHHLRNQKLQNELHDKKVAKLMEKGNFLGTVSTKNPEILGRNSEELNENLSTHDPESTVFVNHAFNPMFHKLHQKRPNLELFFRIDDTGFLPLMLQKLGYPARIDQDLTNEYMGIIPTGTNQLLSDRAKTAHVPISKGCSQFCAFCIVPYARGVEKHLPKEQIFTEVRHHLANGAEEIILLGQIVNKHPDFDEIVREILKMPGLRRLRYTSPYPTFYSDDLLAMHANEPKLCPHIHMPLQSGSDKILKKMFRGYTAAQFREFVDKIRALPREISITSDVIVWFTDETDADFQETLALTEYARFDMIYIGKYSVRSGTYAHRFYEDTVPATEKQSRRSALNDLLRKISTENNHSDHDRQTEILLNKIESDRASGYADNFKNVILKKSDFTPNQREKLSTGEFLTARITGSQAFSLHATPTSST